MLPSCLEYTHKSCDTKGKKGMALYKRTQGTTACCLLRRAALSNHNETLLLLFSWSITASCMEQLFNLV